MGRLDGRIALVTGSAAAGIGRACVAALAAEGARVAATDVDEEAGREQAERLARAGHDVEFTRLDVTREADWHRAVDGVLQRHGRGRLDVLVNNAGICIEKPLEAHTLEEFRRVNEVNLLGTFLGVRIGTAAMARGGGGSIVNISSVAGQVGLPNFAAYTASKGGVRLLTKAVALECGEARNGVRVNSVHPGPIWTSMQAGLFGDTDAARERARSIVPIGFLGEPRDVAEAVVFLASDESAYMTGAELTIDGGMTG